jgi:hypothetical protein
MKISLIFHVDTIIVVKAAAAAAAAAVVVVVLKAVATVWCDQVAILTINND